MFSEMYLCFALSVLFQGDPGLPGKPGPQGPVGERGPQVTFNLKYSFKKESMHMCVCMLCMHNQCSESLFHRVKEEILEILGRQEERGHR